MWSFGQSPSGSLGEEKILLLPPEAKPRVVQPTPYYTIPYHNDKTETERDRHGLSYEENCNI